MNAPPLIRRSREADGPPMLAVINAAAEAYRPVLAPELWHEPYMPAAELDREIADGVAFWVAEDEGRLAGVMGIQDKGEVTLIRHAYVAPNVQRSGIGSLLLSHLRGLTEKPMLIGTWSAATWAITFYEKHGFRVVPERETLPLLQRFWSIPAKQARASVVLGDARWNRG